MWPVIYDFGPFAINSFGTMMALAFLASRYVTTVELDRKGMNGELAWSFMFWAAVGGLGGSRLWALLQDPVAVVHDPSMILSGSGFVWYGGLVGGTVAVSWIIFQNDLPWLAAVDCIAPSLALGQAIGRIGCLLAGDGDWGKVSNLPWAMAYPNAIIGWDYPPGVRVHPAPLYEMTAYLTIFGLLWWMRRKPRPDGTIFWWYLILAPASRFLIEFVRINDPVVLGLTLAQLFSLGLMALGVAMLAARSMEPTASQPIRVGADAKRT